MTSPSKTLLLCTRSSADLFLRTWLRRDIRADAGLSRVAWGIITIAATAALRATGAVALPGFPSPQEFRVKASDRRVVAALQSLAG